MSGAFGDAIGRHVVQWAIMHGRRPAAGDIVIAPSRHRVVRRSDWLSACAGCDHSSQSGREAARHAVNAMAAD
mgnify:CR=1 FL=1